MIPKDFSIYIKNNNTQSVQLSLFQFPLPASLNDELISFEWNLTDETYEFRDLLTLQVSYDNGETFVTLERRGQYQNIDDVIAGLNSFGVGVFTKRQEGGNTFVDIESSVVFYGDIDLQTTTFEPVLEYGNDFLRANNATTSYFYVIARGRNGIVPTISFDNLPSFCTATYFEYAGVRICQVEMTPGGAGDNGNYNFTANASDGLRSASRNYDLLVDGVAICVFDRPYNENFVKQVDDTSPETYTTTGSPVGGFSNLGYAFTSGTFNEDDFSAYVIAENAAPDLDVVVEPSSDPLPGDYVIIAAYNDSGGPVLRANDEILLKITLTPAP